MGGWPPMTLSATRMGRFLSSRRRHTILRGDWSSGVCSSDLHTFLPESRHQYITLVGAGGAGGAGYLSGSQHIQNGGGSAGYELRLRMALTATAAYQVGARSEERRVGKKGRFRWSPVPLKKKK